MTLQLTAEQVWQPIEKELFAVVGMVTADHEARTVAGREEGERCRPMR